MLTKPKKKKYNPELREREDMYKLHYNKAIDEYDKYHNYKMQQYQKKIEEVRGMLKEQIRKLQEYVGGEV